MRNDGVSTVVAERDLAAGVKELRQNLVALFASVLPFGWGWLCYVLFALPPGVARGPG